MKGRTSRREFLALAAAAASGAVGCGRGMDEGDEEVTTELVELFAAEAVGAMGRGELSAEEYAGALLERCREAETLNAFITLEPERVLEAARDADRARASGMAPGPLHGLPIPIKDSVNTRGYPTTGGTRALVDFRPAADAEVVERLLAAGAIVMGKTNIHELSFGWTSNNLAYGAVRNPWDPTRIPGGSSGGTAASVAARMAPLGIAEDTQGSIRVPAALCGIHGFRPTQNRYPNGGVIPITPLFDQVGPHARCVADLALFDHVITGEPTVESPVDLAGLRLGVSRGYYFESLDEEVARITEEAMARLAEAGVELVEAEVPDLATLIGLTTAPVQLYHVRPMVTRYLAEFETGLSFEDVMSQVSEDIAATFEQFVLPGAPGAISETDFVAARDVHLPALRQTMSRYFESNGLDAMIFPAVRIPAPPIGHDREVEIRGETVSFASAISRNISPGSTAGLPGLIVPAALTTEGLPVSLELDGPAGSDRRLLAIGLAIESLVEPLPAPPIG